VLQRLFARARVLSLSLTHTHAITHSLARWRPIPRALTSVLPLTRPCSPVLTRALVLAFDLSHTLLLSLSCTHYFPGHTE